jgi:serine/threonine protein kinase
MRTGSHHPVVVPVGFEVGGWRVTHHIASGSWGSVYAGRRIGDGVGGLPEQVALKFLPAGSLTPAQHSVLAEVVRRERTFSEQVRHRHLIHTYDVLTLDESAGPLVGGVVLVMEQARRSLRDVLDDASGQPVPHAGAILQQLWAALSYMHAQGWVHGDLKPSNVLLAEDGSVRLADFGVSAELDGTHAYTPGIGTQDYLPPEWWEQQIATKGITTRTTTDLWAFGVIAHHVLTGGMHPFPGAAPQARASAAREYASSPYGLRLSPRVPEAWRTIISDCLAASHAERLARTRHLGRRIRAADQHDRRVRRLRKVRRGAGAFVASTMCLLLIASSAPVRSRAEPGELRPDARVPDAYRALIIETAHHCNEPEVTPALIAAMLAVESNFDPNKRSPKTDEYGIAMWTPSVFAGWAPKRPGRRPSVFNARDSVEAMGPFLCLLADTVGYLPGDPQLLIAAGYRVGGKRVRAANGIPPEAREYTEKVRRKIREFGY